MPPVVSAMFLLMTISLSEPSDGRLWWEWVDFGRGRGDASGLAIGGWARLFKRMSEFGSSSMPDLDTTKHTRLAVWEMCVSAKVRCRKVGWWLVVGAGTVVIDLKK